MIVSTLMTAIATVGTSNGDPGGDGLLNQFVRTNFAPPFLIDHFLSAVKSRSSIRDAFIDPSKVFILHRIFVIN